MWEPGRLRWQHGPLRSLTGTFADSWKLTKAAFRQIAEDRALLVFPLVAGFSTLGILTVFALGAFWLVPLAAGGMVGDQVLLVAAFLAMYFATSWVSVYAAAGLIGAASLKLGGQQPSAADGWRVARGRIRKLTPWALIAATVGLVIQVISRRVGGVAGLLIGLVGGATWQVATYFVVPVLLYEEETTWRSLAHYARPFLSTFGRTAVSNLIVGLRIGGGVILALVLGLVGLFLLFGGSLAGGLLLIVVGVALGVAVGLLGAAAEGILRAALYRYALKGKIDPDLLPVAYAGASPLVSAAPAPPLR